METTGFTTLDALDGAWAQSGHGARAKAVLAGAASLRERVAGGPTALSVRTLPLTTLLYPTRYAFGGAALSPAPFVTLTHRCLLVQFRQGAEVKTLLFNPTDIDRARRAPYFARVIERFGETMSSMMVTRFEALEAQLARLGVSPGDIDYVAFDHFHTQDLRGLLGTEDGRTPARFPNATLLASKREWDDWADLHPMQRAWYVADGREGVSTERVHFVERDLELGDGVMLLRTPGHTSGNQTLFVKTDRGVWGVSENGTCADAWSPSSSRVAGVARAASDAGLDVILNANTVEYGADQYTSMLLERAMVDRVPSAPEWTQMFPSSEATPAVTAPGLSPTYLHHRVEHGVVQPRRARDEAPAGFGAAS